MSKRHHFYALIITLLLSAMLLAACDRLLGKDEIVLPTQASLDFDHYQTVIVFTQNAPPAGFETVAFSQVDDNLITTVYSRFEINLYLENGYYSDTGQPVEQGYMRLRVWNDEFHVARHLQMEFLGDVFAGSSSNLDIVRISNDYYMVDVNGVCITDPSVIAEIANLNAGQLIGGFEFAQPTGRQDTINGVEAWQYGFDPQYVNRPAIQLTSETSAVDLLTGEVWVSPHYNIVVRYGIEMNIHRATLLFGNREVTGRLRFQYDVFNIGDPPNISIPNGC